jgi:hypothetical protein
MRLRGVEFDEGGWIIITKGVKNKKKIIWKGQKEFQTK